MEKETIISIQNNLWNMQSCIKNRLNSCLELKMEFQQQIDELICSLKQVELDIASFEEQKEDNFFLLESAQDNYDSEQLLRLMEQREKINEKIEELNQQLDKHLSMNQFLLELNDMLAETVNKVNYVDKNIKDSNSENNNFKKKILERICLCQNLVNVDQNRCKIELSELAKICEE